MATSSLIGDQPAQRFALGAALALPLAGVAAALTGSPAVGLAAIAATGLAWMKPEWLFFLLIASAPVLRSMDSTRFPPEIISQAKTSLMLLVGALGLLRWELARENHRAPRAVFVLGGAWVLLTFAAILHAVNPSLALRYLPMTLAGTAAFAFAFQLEEKNQKRLIWITLAIGGAIGLVTLLQFVIVTYGVAGALAPYVVEPRTQAFFSTNPLGETRYRPSGTMFHPNSMGLYFALLLPFAVSLVAATRLRWQARWLAAFFAVAMGLGLYATNSRAAMVAAVGGLGFLILHAGYRWLGALGLLSVSGLAAYATLPQSEAFRQGMENFFRVGAGLSGRAAVWDNALELIGQSPFLGVGPANFTTEYVARFGYFVPNSVQELLGQLWSFQRLTPDRFISNFHAHNIYLQLAGEMGWLAPLLLVITLVWLIYHSEKRAQEKPSGSMGRGVALATASFAAALACYGFFDSQYSFTLDSINLVIGPLLAIGLSMPEESPEDSLWEPKAYSA